ncbi:MAG: radical SAM protein [Clostridia bacterium]|nr:radical SAM protein [Clostridia bacterium]
MENQAPFIAVSRHRIQTDGEGVTTLCGFYGCPLRCKYCINPQSFREDAKRIFHTPESLYNAVKLDDIYFLATNGGVTFGGGEPLLYVGFIKEFRALCGDKWHLCAETSLNVSSDAVRLASSVIDHFYVDIKDMNPEIYQSYTGKSNDNVIENLKLLLSLTSKDRITLRIPLIKDFNTESDREKSVSRLKEMGFTDFDLFNYVIKRK